MSGIHHRASLSPPRVRLAKNYGEDHELIVDVRRGSEPSNLDLSQPGRSRIRNPSGAVFVLQSRDNPEVLFFALQPGPFAVQSKWRKTARGPLLARLDCGNSSRTRAPLTCCLGLIYKRIGGAAGPCLSIDVLHTNIRGAVKPLIRHPSRQCHFATEPNKNPNPDRKCCLTEYGLSLRCLRWCSTHRT